MAPHSLQHYVPFISAWPCNTPLPNGTLAIRCTFSYLQRASFGSTSHWKRWRQTLQQSLCPWTSFCHRWSSSTQWHRTHCSTMFPSYQRLWRGLVYFLGKGAEKARSKRDQSEIKRDANEGAPCNIYPQKLATVHAMATFIAQALRRLYATNVWQCVCVFAGLWEFSLSELVSN